ncbi:MAG: SusC/RagA family TonB-linked outer membrane protein [Cyclobacteriaceae bacterium]
MKKFLLLILVYVSALGVTLAQDRAISGTVTDAETGEGIPGANVVIKGTANGTITDFNGEFKLNVPEGTTLVLTYVGYATVEVEVGARSVIDVSMGLDVEQLAEIVVIGYGEQSIKDATGAVASVSSKDFNGGVISSPEQLIQGKTAGVQITQSSGAPGAGVELRIRGTNSVRSNNNPLFVVDGVPLAGDNTGGDGANVGFGTSGASNPLNFLNPNDIESISILKDASSAAIYGSRGANGVVFITTKKGSGKNKVLEFSTSASIASPANEYDLLGREGFLAGITQFGGDASEQDFGNETDWQDFITRTSFSHKQNLSYATGYETGSIRASLGYEDQQGIIENSSLERITGRVNWNQFLLNDKLTLNISTTVSRVNEQFAPIGGSAGFRGDLLGAAYSANPTWPESLDGLTDQQIGDIVGGQLHPGNMLNSFNSTGATNRVLMNASASYKLTDDLSAKVTYGLDRSANETFGLSSANGRNFDRGTFQNGRGAYTEIDVLNNLFEATVTYNKDFGNSSLELLGGYSYQDFGREGFNSEGWGFASTDFGQMESDLQNGINAINDLASSQVSGFYQQVGLSEALQGGASGTPTTGVFVNSLLPTIGTSYFNEPAGINVQSLFMNRFDFTDKLQSYFGRANYTINNKYIFTATVRADGSSRFGTDERYGVFPSGAFAWKLHEEDFIGGAFSTLKLRLGWGITGNQDGLGYGGFVRRERYDDRLNSGIDDNGQVTIPGTSSIANPNPDLRWESTTQYNLGFDFGFSDERFSGTFDLYRKETSDILLRLNAAQPAANTFIFDNFDATVVNQGFELTLNYDVIRKNDFTFTAGWNYAHNDNEILDFAGQIPAGTIRGQGLSQAFAQLLAQDQPLFSYFLREFEGFDDAGQPIGDNQSFVGRSALPTVNTGLSLNFTYKNWDLAAFMAGQFGHYIYNNTRNAFFTAGAINNGRNVTPDVLTSGEAGSAEAAVSTRFLESGDFVRLQNLSLGYNVPVQNSSFIRNLRVYLNAQNLFVITDYTGVDPEVSSQPAQADLLNNLPTAGIDYTAYPRPRVFTLGINASF